MTKCKKFIWCQMTITKKFISQSNGWRLVLISKTSVESKEARQPQTTRHEPQYLFYHRRTNWLRNLNVIFDSKLPMRQHVSKLSSTCFFHLCHLRPFRRMLDPSSQQWFVSAFILSHIDFCNAMLAGLPACMHAPLQHVLNAAERFIASLNEWIL